MKKIFTLAMMMAMTITARSAMPLGSSKNAMSYTAAKNEALFLSDKMAYELNLTDAQYDAVYEINLDYLMCVNGRNDAYGTWWNRRNTDLKYVLTAWQYEKFMDKSDRFYADKKVNKPASTPTAKNGHSNNGKNNRHIAQNTTKNSGSGHFGGRR